MLAEVAVLVNLAVWVASYHRCISTVLHQSEDARISSSALKIAGSKCSFRGMVFGACAVCQLIAAPHALEGFRPTASEREGKIWNDQLISLVHHRVQGLGFRVQGFSPLAPHEFKRCAVPAVNQTAWHAKPGLR